MKSKTPPKASRMNMIRPEFLSREGRLVASRRSRRAGAEDLRLVGRALQLRVSPCPECDGAGLHKRRCGFYLDRAGIQFQSNPNPRFNATLSWIAKATGGLPA